MNSDIKKRAEEMLSKLSLKEKIAQLNQEMLGKGASDELKDKIRRGETGSVILANSSTAGNDKQQKLHTALVNELQRIAVEESPSGIPLIFGRDVIHGHNTVLPVPLALAASFNPELVRQGYRCVAKEAANDGVQWAFSPMIDISRDPRWGRCIEGIGEDPYLGERMAEAVVRGFQGEDYTRNDGIAACAKHYIGYGAVEGGRDYGKAEISDYTLRNCYLKPFKAAVKAGLGTVMNSFNEVSGVSTSASRYLLTEVLKEELEFDGYIVSDWATIPQLVVQGVAEDVKDAARLAVNAGLDMDMVSRSYIENLETLVKEGKVSEETINQSVLRVLYIKLLFGIIDNPYAAEPVAVDVLAHTKTAKACSDETMILLKNKDGILPLKPETKVFAAGPMLYEKRALLGSWTLDGDISRVSSLAEALIRKSENILFPSSPYLWDDYLKRIRREECDVIILALGESEKTTGEANSLASVELSAEQLELVKKLKRLDKPIIGVMTFGRPIALEDAEKYFDAILYTWHSGSCTADSAADILYGYVNPSGKTPMTFPRCTGQIPIYYNCSDGPSYGRSYYRDTRLSVYNDRLATPMYPFGFGLSYTNFEYNSIRCDRSEISYDELKNGEKFRICAEVKNTGEKDGKEVSQCYICDKTASMIRPQRELKGFSKNIIKAGETKTICFELGWDELAFYNENREFKPEAGGFEIYVGTDSYAELSVTVYVTD